MEWDAMYIAKKMVTAVLRVAPLQKQVENPAFTRNFRRNGKGVGKRDAENVSLGTNQSAEPGQSDVSRIGFREHGCSSHPAIAGFRYNLGVPGRFSHRDLRLPAAAQRTEDVV